MGISIRGLAPLLQVFDMPTSIRFYRDFLGFEVIQTSGGSDDCFGWVLLRLNGVEVMLNTAYDEDERPAEPDPTRIGGHADTALFFSCPDVGAVYTHLRAQGLPVEAPVVRDYGMKQLYVIDPDGFVLCFQWPVAENVVGVGSG
jgi:glyoxylase I family protein